MHKYIYLLREQPATYKVKIKNRVGMSKRFSPEFKAKVALEAESLNNNNQVAIKYSLDQKTVRIWRRQLTQNAASLFVERKEEPAGPEPVFVWPLTLHNRRIEKWKRKSKRKAFVELFSPKTKKCKKQILFATRPPYPDKYIASLPEEERAVADFIYNTYMEKPWMGTLRMSHYARMHGYSIGVSHIRTFFSNMGITTTHSQAYKQKKRSEKIREPYLLQDKTIWLPNQVWGTDITYLIGPTRNLYMSVAIDWYSRKIVGYHISSSLSTETAMCCIENAIDEFGAPAIINSDQGRQYCSYKYKDFLKANHIRQSMNRSREKYVDNSITERFFCSLKNELIYLRDFPNERKMRESIEEYIVDYNSMRPHSTHNYQPPDWVYFAAFSGSPVSDDGLARNLEEIRIRKQNTVDRQEYVTAKIIPEEIENKIVAEYLAGRSQSALAREYPYGHSIIVKILKRNGVDMSEEALAERRRIAAEKQSGYKEEDIIALYQSGKSIPAIAEIYSISNYPVSRVLRKYNIPTRISKDYTKGKPRRRYSKNIDEDEILRLYLSGLSIEKIQKQMNISRGPIDRVLRREHVQMRTIVDYQKKKK